MLDDIFISFTPYLLVYLFRELVTRPGLFFLKRGLPVSRVHIDGFSMAALWFSAFLDFLTTSVELYSEREWDDISLSRSRPAHYHITETVYLDTVPWVSSYSEGAGLDVFDFGVDALSRLLLFLLAVLSLVVTLLPTESYEEFVSQSAYFAVFDLLISWCFTTLDLFFFFIVFEMLTLPMFLLFSIYGSRDRKVLAYWFFLFYTLVGSVPFLLGIIYINSLTGSTCYIVLESFFFSFNDQRLLWLLCLPSILFKLPICPFHLWLPEAHVEASTPVSVFLAGILLKLGGYAYIRFLLGLFPLGNLFYLNWLITLLAFSCLWSSLVSVIQVDLKRIVAYMSVGHMSLAVMVLNTLSVSGFNSGVLTFLGHGFLSSALFVLVGALYERHHTRFIYHFSGLRTVMPFFSFYFLFFVLSNIGFPGSPSFISELLAVFSLIDFSILALFVILLSVFILVITNMWLLHILYGPVNTSVIYVYRDLSISEISALSLLAFGSLALGLFPESFFGILSEVHFYYTAKSFNINFVL